LFVPVLPVLAFAAHQLMFPSSMLHWFQCLCYRYAFGEGMWW